MAVESGGPREVIWFCKIGGTVPEDHSVNEHDMRLAVEREFRLLADVEPEFTFSGMGGELDEAERAVVEDRDPDFFLTTWAEQRVHAVRKALRAGEPLPEYTPAQWMSLLVVKLGQATLALAGDPEDPPTEVEREMGQGMLLALAASTLDAWEALG